MQKSINITSGNIRRILLQLATPIISSNFIQTAFGMINMIWIGRLGSEAVSSIGTATFYINLAQAISTLVVIGSGVKIAQSLGAKKEKDAQTYVRNGIILSVIFSILFVVVIGIFSKPLIDFYKMSDPAVELMSLQYLRHSLVSVPLLFLTTIVTTILTSYGYTKVTFKANSIGLLVNIILDPILIFGFSFIPAFGVVGAAWATTIARLVTLLIQISSATPDILGALHVRQSWEKMVEVMKMSWPVTAQQVIFIGISIMMAKLIVQFGTDSIAVQKIGVQIESISYITIGGLQGAIAAFIGQNIGAKKYDRVDEGYKVALKLVFVFGTLVSTLFVMFPGQIFSIFIQDPVVIEQGKGYMYAIGFSQLFMCLELLTVGAFNGVGKTYAPPIVSIIFSAMRIPLAMFLSSFMGVEGIWWSISISSMIKGTVLMTWFLLDLKKTKGKLLTAEIEETVNV